MSGALRDPHEVVEGYARQCSIDVTSVDQLGDVDGIGPARLEKLRDLVHV